MSDRPMLTVNGMPAFRRQVKAEAIARVAVYLSRPYVPGDLLPTQREAFAADRKDFDGMTFDQQLVLVGYAKELDRYRMPNW